LNNKEDAFIQPGTIMAAPAALVFITKSLLDFIGHLFFNDSAFESNIDIISHPGSFCRILYD